MSQHYSDPARASYPHALPGIRQAMIWYRAGDDADTSIRPYWQMGLGADTLDEALASLRAQGYRVQRVAIEIHCAKCQGSGREHYRPKGFRGARNMRRDFLPQRACSACKGHPIFDWEQHDYTPEALADAQRGEE